MSLVCKYRLTANVCLSEWKVDAVVSGELWKSPYDKPNDKYLEGWDD